MKRVGDDGEKRCGEAEARKTSKRQSVARALRKAASADMQALPSAGHQDRVPGVPADRHVLVALEFGRLLAQLLDDEDIARRRGPDTGCASPAHIRCRACLRARCRRLPGLSTKRMNSGRMTRWPEVKPCGMFGGRAKVWPKASAVSLPRHSVVTGNDIHVADEFGDELVARRGVDLVRRADLDQLARAHDADAVGHHHRLLETVGDVDEGLAGLAVDVLQLLLERLAQLVVDGRQRLVEEQDFGIEGERAGERDALALAARALR